MIVLDANVLIAFMDASDHHHDEAISLFEHHFLEGFSASVLTVAEALVHPVRHGRHDAVLASLATIAVEVVPLESGQAAELARIRNDYRLRMPDAVTLHAAIATGASLATFDESLASAAQSAGVAVVI